MKRIKLRVILYVLYVRKIRILNFTVLYIYVSAPGSEVKLGSLGIGTPLLSWLKSYISNRQQLINMLSFASTSIVVLSCVPHSDHLNPLLFLLFVNSVIN